MDWVHDQSPCVVMVILLDRAVGNGDAEFARQIYGSETDKHSSLLTHKGIDDTAVAGHLKILQWLGEHGNKMTSVFTMQCAAAAGHIKWHYEQDNRDEYTRIHGSMAIQRSLRNTRFPICLRAYDGSRKLWRMQPQGESGP